MAPSGADKPKTVKLLVADNRLQAWLQPLGLTTAGFSPPTIEDVQIVLDAVKFAVTPEVKKRLEEFVQLCTEGAKLPPETRASKVPEKFLIAEGRPAVNAEDGRFEWSPELARKLAKPDADEQVDYFSVNAIVSVSRGTVVGRVHPPTEGAPSVDVFGVERPPRKPHGTPVKLGPGLRLGGDSGMDVVAESDGRIAEENGKYRLYDVLEVPGDVDFSSGSVDAVVDVLVRGTVRANFHVRTDKSLTVDRLIEAADVSVGGDVTVRGGLFGQDGRGHVKAGGKVTANFINEMRVEAGGDICFEKEILNSKVRAKGKLLGERGTIIGGQIHAREGVQARVLGSDANVETHVGTGTDVNILRRVRQGERREKELQRGADQIRQAIKPLMANIKRLLPAQRERVTELMSKSDEIELQITDNRQERERLLKEAAPQGNPGILVVEAAHPGTHLTIGVREVRLQKLLHGPVKIELRKVENVTQVVAVNQRTASITVLPSTDVDLDAPPTDEAQGDTSHATDASAARNRPA